jgi:hypothetical protein
MAEAMSTIRADFDRIALLPGEAWDHSIHYHGFLLQHVPSPCRNRSKSVRHRRIFTSHGEIFGARARA